MKIPSPVHQTLYHNDRYSLIFGKKQQQNLEILHEQHLF